jgi:hypothetical protein
MSWRVKTADRSGKVGDTSRKITATTSRTLTSGRGAAAGDKASLAIATARLVTEHRFQGQVREVRSSVQAA